MSVDNAESDRIEEACKCPPCPGRGNDGHGTTRCAECCFGTGVEADIICLLHGDPYDRPVQIQGHMHAEPICAWPNCQTYLTRDDMRILHATQRRYSPGLPTQPTDAPDVSEAAHG